MRRSAFVVTVSAVTACATSCSRSPAPAPEPTSVTAPPPDPVPEPRANAHPDPSTEPAPATDAGTATNRDLDAAAKEGPPRLSDYSTTLNPRDSANRTIKRAWQGDQCFVELPFPPLKPGQMRPPGSAPPAQTVPCPPSMLTPAYEQCRGGVVHGKPDGSSCVCFVMGNPPPPPTRIACPKP